MNFKFWFFLENVFKNFFLIYDFVVYKKVNEIIIYFIIVYGICDIWIWRINFNFLDLKIEN